MGNEAGASTQKGARRPPAEPGKSRKICIRVTPEQEAGIKARALGERKTLTDYLVGRALFGEPARFLPEDEVAEMIRLRIDVGKATGMLKHSVAQGVRDGPGIMAIERQYRAIADQLAEMIKRMARILAGRQD